MFVDRKIGIIDLPAVLNQDHNIVKYYLTLALKDIFFSRKLQVLVQHISTFMATTHLTEIFYFKSLPPFVVYSLRLRTE